MAIFRTQSRYIALVIAVAFVLGFVWQKNQRSLMDMLQYCNWQDGQVKEEIRSRSGLQMKIDEVFNKIQKLIPNVTFTFFNESTSGKNSNAFIVNPQEKHCVGEDLVVQLDMYDYLGKRKTYGGDFIRTRLFSPELGASVSGRIKDYNNGTYHIHFPLFWKGKVKVSAMLFHPSEGISALWRSRHSSLGVLGFKGKFVNYSQEVVTDCGFKVYTDQDVCEYLDPDDEEAFYCIKPPNLSCDLLNDMRAFELGVSYLTNEEKKLFQRSNIAVEIPQNFNIIDAADCERHNTTANPKCQTGMSSPFPSGYFYNNVWKPVYCNMTFYKTPENFTKCLQGKKLYLIGDSTLRQFIMHFTEGIKIVNYFGYHEKQWAKWAKTLLALNMEKDIYVSYKRHGFPLEHTLFYYFKEDRYTSRQIDQIAGGRDTIIVITMGQHFRQFPLHLYIRRAINIHRAIERIFLRSPETKVIIKTENTREMQAPVERIGDFHGYTQYLVLREVFQGTRVGFVDAWDMTVSSATANVHPPGYTFQSIMSMTFSFAC
ncbi:NXPE family member 4-like [Spea bombifrons]|uniref:NXPE family member 4-like n=1 Tax=Spea bombifrons TaxID=233779 RepID=UPI00234B5CB4|nr:NXPE family member 4-like [Spea bombifrons]XP_053316798.1 NXPE family member 4-like [Spea bombifrons]